MNGQGSARHRASAWDGCLPGNLGSRNNGHPCTQLDESGTRGLANAALPNTTSPSTSTYVNPALVPAYCEVPCLEWEWLLRWDSDRRL